MTVSTTQLRRLAITSPALTAVSLAMLPLLCLNLAGLVLDPRLVTGAPVWMKPAKFAISIAIYGLTLAWVFTFLDDRPRLRRIVGALTAVVFAGEAAVINLQAWRGIASHFNVATPLNAVLFSAMGTGIVVQTLSMIAVAVALWRTRFADRALGTALAAGLTIAIAGAATGGLMTRPTPEQLTAMKAGERPTMIGAHTVGAPDGEHGLPMTGWSAQHGDVRVPHFVGLHAFQILPLIAIALRRRMNAAASLRLVWIASSSYAAIFALLLSQALAGQSVAAPSPAFAVAFAAWFIVTVTAIGVVLAPRFQRRAIVATWQRIDERSAP